jgi:hypothetical protein
LKDEEAIDWRGGFQSFHWARGTNLRKGHGGLPREREVSWVGERKKEKKECVRKKKGLVLMGEKVLFMREMCARIKHGRISMTKPLKFYFKQLFLPNPPLDLCETLKNICLGGLKGSPKFQHHRFGYKGAALAGSGGCCSGVHGRISMTRPV